jgi:endo-1,4-beta-xylanase
MALVVGCQGGTGTPEPTHRGTGVDLLSGRDWSHFAGAERRPDGVHITGLGRRITKQDGSGGQANPPVNLRGPGLRVAGDFEVEATMREVGGGAFLQLYAEVPVIFDEWRQEGRSVRLGILDGRVRLAVWDGGGDDPVLDRELPATVSDDSVRIGLRKEGDRLRVTLGGRVVGEVPAGDIFAGGRVWFGADATTGGRGWILSALRARAGSGGQVEVFDAPALSQQREGDALRSRAERATRVIGIGTALAVGPLLTDAGYRRIAANEFSVVTPENDLKPQFVQPRPGRFAFAEGDTLVDFARANGQRVHAHTLVWFEALPAWMRAPMSAGRRRAVMVAHIRAVAGHFRGRVAEWDVVNEPMSDEDEDYAGDRLGVRPNLWFEAMGESYIDLAFREAHAADPGAALYLNEYGAEEDGPRWDALLALAGRLVARGVPIDGVGFQNHEYEEADRTDPEVFRRHVRALGRLGLSARVSEMDVLVDEPTSDEADVQAREYADKMRVCRQEPNCTTFGLWGFTDRYGSTADVHTYPPSPGNALPWDTALRPKPAYRALLAGLAGPT